MHRENSSDLRTKPMNLRHDVWAQLFLADSGCERLREFFVRDVGVDPQFIARKMHVTVYHARGSIPALSSTLEPVNVVLPANDTRFMVMAPGGENPRENLDPSSNKVGVRIQRQSSAMAPILCLRERLIQYETKQVLRNRESSTSKKSAFGARNFQPHMTILLPGSGIPRELTLLGKAFRERIGDMLFDRFQIEVGRPNRR